MLDLSATFATFPVLETERFQLRAVEPADAHTLFRIRRDPRVMRYFGREPMLVLDEAVELVARMRESFSAHQSVRWVIAERADPAMIGSVGFWRLLPEHHRAEIGYDLAPEWWGQGVMPEAARAVLDFGFDSMGLHTVEANIHPDNAGSRRVLEKLGFRQEGYFRESFYEPATGTFSDNATFGLLAADWQARRSGC